MLPELVMNTIEIAEVINQPLHTVNKNAREMFMELYGRTPPADRGGYLLNKDDSLNLAMYYSPTLRKKVIDALNAKTLPDFTNPVAAARAWADSQEQLLLAQPKVDFADAIAAASDSENLGEFCKALGYGYNKGLKALRLEHIIKTGRSPQSREQNMPFEKYNKYFEVIEELGRDGTYHLVTYVKPEGKAWVHSKLKEHFGE